MDNYTGPYWSDGKIQPSIEFGNSIPTDEVDAESRLHDSAFAHFGDERHRLAADYIYKKRLEKVPGFKSAFVRNIPFYGNLADSSHLSGLLTPFSLLTTVDYFRHVAKVEREIANGLYDKEIADVLNYYATDPMITTGINPKITPFMGEHYKGTELGSGSGVYHPSPASAIEADVDPFLKRKKAWEDPPGPKPYAEDPVVDITIDLDGNIKERRARIPEVVQVLASDNFEILQPGQRISQYVYNPYRPLKKKRYKITQRMVDMYNKYHGTNYTLDEVIAIKGDYL